MYYACPVVVTAMRESKINHPHVCTVKVEGKEVTALLDSGSMLTLVEAKLVPISKLDKDEALSITCVHGDTRSYPSALISLETTEGKLEYEVRVV